MFVVYIYIYIYIYIYSSIYRHVFRCQCRLEQYEWVSPITLAHAIVSDYSTTAQVTTTSRQREVRVAQSAQTSTRVVSVALLLIGVHGNFTECSTTPKWRSVHSSIYRHVFRCTTAHQCILEQSEFHQFLLVIYKDTPHLVCICDMCMHVQFTLM